MSGLPTVFGGSVLDFVTGRGVSTVYLALLTADPGDSPTVASLAEDTTSGYSRQAPTFAVPSGDPASTINTNLVTFGPYTANQASPVTHIALVEHASGTSGVVRYVWELDASVQALSTQTLLIPIGSLVLTD